MLGPSGETGNHSGFKLRRRKACRFESDLGHRGVAESADALASKASACKGMRVRVPPPRLL